MRTITKEQKYILYALGQLYEESNKKLGNKGLALVIDKVTFIEIAMKSKVVGKKERALYKNLEELQKRKLIAYENKELELTKRGDLIFQKMKKELLPYLELNNVIKTQKPLKYTKRAQTVFRKK